MQDLATHIFTKGKTVPEQKENVNAEIDSRIFADIFCFKNGKPGHLNSHTLSTNPSSRSLGSSYTDARDLKYS